MRAISRSNGSTSLQNLGFLYDKVGSLIQRQDNRLGLTEDITYDNLHRIETSKVGPTIYSYDFDALGNVTLKTDFGTGLWTYDSVKKHQLLSAAGGAVTYTYDANGNALTRNGQSITWTTYNYPSRIKKSATEYDDFFYGPNRERWKQIYTSPTVSETTISLGKFLEKVTSGGSTEWRHYLFVGDQAVAVYSRSASGNPVRYILRDHQGSVAALASNTGALIVNESFQPFGQRRNGSTWQLPIPNADLTTINAISRRGYTDHNDLGGAPLIHMNGRVQDPLTGRFLSADLYVTSPMSTQGWNRFSYVENSPATFVDPTGFCLLGLLGEPAQCEDVVVTASRVSNMPNWLGPVSVGSSYGQLGVALYVGIDLFEFAVEEPQGDPCPGAGGDAFDFRERHPNDPDKGYTPAHTQLPGTSAVRAPNGQPFYAPPDADFVAVYNYGRGLGMSTSNPASRTLGYAMAHSYGGLFDFQRYNNTFNGAYAYAANYAIGIDVQAAGDPLALAHAYASAVKTVGSRGKGDPKAAEAITQGFEAAASGSCKK